MKSTFFLTSIFLISFLFLGCPSQPEIQTKMVFKGTIHQAIKGFPVISNAKVMINGKSVISDKMGKFQLELTQKKDFLIKILHPDYITYIKNVNFELSVTKKEMFFLMHPKAPAFLFDTRKDLSYKPNKNIEIFIPANSLILENNKIPEEALIRLTYINPKNSLELRATPGNFIEERNGNYLPLETFGLWDIEINDTKGNNLDFIKGQSGKIAILPTDSLRRNIGLYQMNFSSAYWENVGELNFNIKTGRLEGEVTEASSTWNADEPCGSDLICVTVQTIRLDNTPANCYVGAEGLSYNGFYGLVSPDNNGSVDLMVCPNSSFELQACYYPCLDCPGHAESKVIDLSTVSINPDGCTDLGVWQFQLH